MKIVFKTAPLVVRRHFPRVRVRLSGFYAWNEPKPAVVVWQAKQAKTRLNDPKDVENAGVARSGLAARIAIQAFRFLLLFISLISIGVLAVVFIPGAYYQLFPADTQPVANYQQHMAESTPNPSPIPQIEKPVLPPFDPSLPEGKWLVIPRIGVRTPLQATTNPEEALQKGVWQVPDYGQPGDTDIPMIVAGHRYGWQWWWKTDYWKYNSFYNLPTLEVGDRVEVIADQRKWVYEVYAAEEGTEITDYEADMVLYTCKFLNSPIRYFLYAKLVPTTPQ